MWRSSITITTRRWDAAVRLSATSDLTATARPGPATEDEDRD